MGILRAKHSPEVLIGALAHAAGILERNEPCTAAELIPLFDWKKLGREDKAIEI